MLERKEWSSLIRIALRIASIRARDARDAKDSVLARTPIINELRNFHFFIFSRFFLNRKVTKTQTKDATAEGSRARDEIQKNAENRNGGPFSLARANNRRLSIAGASSSLYFALLCSWISWDLMTATFAKWRYRKSNLHTCDAPCASANTDSSSAKRATRTMRKLSSGNCGNEKKRERERERERENSATWRFSRKPEGNIFPVPSILPSSHQYRCDRCRFR